MRLPEPELYRRYDDHTAGVYLQREFTPRALPQFCTGVPAFLGTPARPANSEAPVRITLWSQYRGQFGGAPNLLSFAVRGFFENGGTVCFVIPVKGRRLEHYRRGLEVIEDLEDIDLVSVPEFPEQDDRTPDRNAFVDLQRDMMRHCQALGDRFALLDPLPDQSGDELVGQWHRTDNGYAALYYPWLKVPGVRGITESLVPVPPSPYVAGVIARVDAHSGPGEAPANEVVEGVADVAAVLDLTMQERLSQTGVNYIQPFRGRGFRVWGARTMSPFHGWRYINVRRVVITVLRWLRENMRDVPFERDGPRLWARIDREITSYLMSLFRSGTLKGSSPDEAFYVSTSGLRDGTVVTRLGVAPAVPFEFIAVRLIHGESGVVLSAPDEN
jgi:hypothetical protein